MHFPSKTSLSPPLLLFESVTKKLKVVGSFSSDRDNEYSEFTDLEFVLSGLRCCVFCVESVLCVGSEKKRGASAPL